MSCLFATHAKAKNTTVRSEFQGVLAFLIRIRNVIFMPRLLNGNSIFMGNMSQYISRSTVAIEHSMRNCKTWFAKGFWATECTFVTIFKYAKF